MKDFRSLEFKLKTRDEVDRALEEFCAIESNDYDYIKNAFFNLFGIYTVPVIFFNKDVMKALSLFRARPSSQINDINNVSNFSFPPLNIKVPTQRANWTGRNVFYASDTPYTALIESKIANEGNEFYISQWSFKYEKFPSDSIQINTLAIDNTSTDNQWSPILKGQKDFFKELKKGISEKQADVLSYLSYKISLMFTELDKKKYSLTAFIADQIIYFKGDKKNELSFPILIFPSVEANLSTCNFVINPRLVKEYMYLEKVLKVKIDNILKGGFKISYTDIGIPSKENHITWYKTYINIEKSEYCVRSIKCICGHEFDITNLDNQIFNTINGSLTLPDIIKESLNSLSNVEELPFDNIFREKKLVSAIHEVYTSKLKGVSLTENDVKHSDLTIEFVLRQPVEYRKI